MAYVQKNGEKRQKSEETSKKCNKKSILTDLNNK